MRRDLSQHGNALFIILIAVVLFAALSYAVTHSTRTGGGNVSNEKMELAFDEMQNIVIGHKTALERMVSGGIDPENISFYMEDYYIDNTKCTNDSCRVYNPKGGGLPYYKFRQAHPDLTPSTTDQYADSAGPLVTWVAYQGTEKADYIYAFKITESFCNFINSKLGVTTLTGAMTATALGMYQLNSTTIGTLGNFPHQYALAGGEAPHLYGRNDGCFKTNSNAYIYFATIQAL